MRGRAMTIVMVAMVSCASAEKTDHAVVHLSAPSATTAPPPVAALPPTATDPCTQQVCRGQVGGEVEQGIVSIARQTRRRCYDPALAEDPSLEGKVIVRLRIEASGAICSARVMRNDMKDASVAECAAKILAGQSVPPPEDGCVDVDVPLVFVPMGKDAGP